MNKTVFTSFTILCLLSTVFLAGLAFDIKPVKASGTIYIRANGLIDPPTAPISTVDNITYTFTNNINDSIVIERSNIVVDGIGYTLQGTSGTGIDLTGRSNVTIRKINIKDFIYAIYVNSTYCNITENNIANNYYGIYLLYSSNNRISGNNIANNIDGICINSSSGNNIDGNNIEANNHYGISLSYSSNNDIYGNTIANQSWGAGSSGGILLDSCSDNRISTNSLTNNSDGIELWDSSNNSVFKNHIANSELGTILWDSSNNTFYHNNFIDSLWQVWIPGGTSTNVWDDGYPSGGNYWSDHACVGNPSNGSQPYIIDHNNIDHYPFQDTDGWLKVHNVDTGLDYATIQEAINASETLDGHTILVDAGIYYEHVVVNKSLSLFGEDSSTTVIDGNYTGNIVTITASHVNITNFTIQNSGGCLNSGILICDLSTNNSISDNIITNNYAGIEFYLASNYNYVSGNLITNNDIGIEICYSTNNKIVGNNIIANSWSGIEIAKISNHTIIYGNKVIDNQVGIRLQDSSYNQIYHNSFINNTQQAWTDSVNFWDDSYPSGGNYWSNYVGTDQFSGPYQNAIGYDWIGDSPYIINQNNTDRYPLMHPFVPETEEMRISYRNLLLKFAELHFDLKALNSTYYELLDAQRQLISQFRSLNSTYSQLLDNYSQLLRGFDTLNASYTSLQNSYHDLQADLDALKMSYGSLDLRYNNLQANFDSLNSSYNDLRLSYNQLNSSYTNLQSLYSQLNSSFTSLQKDQKTIINGLDTIRNLMYVFIAIMVIFTVATAYLAMRKPKIKPPPPP